MFLSCLAVTAFSKSSHHHPPPLTSPSSPSSSFYNFFLSASFIFPIVSIKSSHHSFPSSASPSCCSLVYAPGLMLQLIKSDILLLPPLLRSSAMPVVYFDSFHQMLTSFFFSFLSSLAHMWSHVPIVSSNAISFFLLLSSSSWGVFTYACNLRFQSFHGIIVMCLCFRVCQWDFVVVSVRPVSHF